MMVELKDLPPESKMVAFTPGTDPPLDCWMHFSITLSYPNGETEKVPAVLMEDAMIKEHTLKGRAFVQSVSWQFMISFKGATTRMRAFARQLLARF